jgi:lycopene cyclase domain-containing protein
VLPAIALSALFFIAWDMLFTELGVWGFNTRYMTGIYLFNLPVEEVLFFICIPYACLFTYFALNTLVEKDHLFPHHELITSFLIIVTLITGIYYLDRLYTAATFLLTGFFLAYHMLKVRPRYMGRFYFAFAILLIPFLIVNGILTGTFIQEPVVWYNNAETMGVRLMSIPLEDIFYGMMMVLTPVFIEEKIESGYQKIKSPGRSGLLSFIK